MADGRKEGAKKGWETRRARLRVLNDSDYVQLQNNRIRQHATLQEAEKVYQDDAFNPPGWWATFIRWLLRSG